MGARVMLTLLISYRSMKEIYASQSTYGKILGVSRQTISKYLKELEKPGFIERISQGDGKTCIIKLLPPVTNSITSCKEYFTQETITKKECVSEGSLDKSIELAELFEYEMRFQPEQAERDEWIACFEELLCQKELTHGRLLLVIYYISNNEFWKKRIYTPLQLREKDEFGVIRAIRFWRESIKIKGDL